MTVCTWSKLATYYSRPGRILRGQAEAVLGIEISYIFFGLFSSTSFNSLSLQETMLPASSLIKAVPSFTAMPSSMRLTVPILSSSFECTVVLRIFTRPPTLITRQFSHPSQRKIKLGRENTWSTTAFFVCWLTEKESD